MKLSDKKENAMNELDNLIRLARTVAKPWCICTWILAVLLAVSIGINAWLIVKGGPVISFDADDNIESSIEQTNNG